MWQIIWLSFSTCTPMHWCEVGYTPNLIPPRAVLDEIKMCCSQETLETYGHLIGSNPLGPSPAAACTQGADGAAGRTRPAGRSALDLHFAQDGVIALLGVEEHVHVHVKGSLAPANLVFQSHDLEVPMKRGHRSTIEVPMYNCTFKHASGSLFFFVFWFWGLLALPSICARPLPPICSEDEAVFLVYVV